MVGGAIDSPRVVLTRLKQDEGKPGPEVSNPAWPEVTKCFLDEIENEEIDEKEDDKENQAKNDQRMKGSNLLAQWGRTRRSPLAEITPKVKISEGKENVPFVKESGSMTELSEYERIRLKNIAERRDMFKALQMEFAKLKESMQPKRRIVNTAPRRFKPYFTRKEPPTTRRRSGLGSSGNSESGRSRSGTPESDIDLEALERACHRRRSHPRESRACPDRWGFNPNESVIQPEDVTPEMLAGVTFHVSDKVYGVQGTTCHQCRQKTLDVKTICRSGRCQGARGMFCGVCLKNRYGEDVRVALKDPNWMCPPCLDVCNCSICRNRLGKGATGPITYLAHSKGFTNVKDYLASLTQNRGCDEFDED